MTRRKLNLLLIVNNLLLAIEVVREGNEWMILNLGLIPLVWGKELVGSLDGLVCGNEEVEGGLGVAKGGSEEILKASHLKEFLGNRASDNARSTRGWNETHADGTALAGNCVRDSMWLADLVAPEATAHWKDGEFGINSSALDSVGNFGSSLDAEADMALEVTNSGYGLKAGTLAGTGLLLDWHDLHDLVLQILTKEMLYNLSLFDWDGMVEDLFDGLYLTRLDKAAKFGAWLPSSLLLTTAETAWATARTTAVTAAHFTTGSLALWCLDWCWCLRHSKGRP